MEWNTRGHLLYSTLATWSGVGQPRIWLSGSLWENIWLFPCMFPTTSHTENERGPNAWKIPLGRRAHVPCGVQELWWPNGSPILPRRWWSCHRPWIYLAYRYVLQEKRAATQVCHTFLLCNFKPWHRPNKQFKLDKQHGGSETASQTRLEASLATASATSIHTVWCPGN